MSFQASFKQILNEKMTEGRSTETNYAGVINSDPSHLAYLMGHVGRVEFQTRRGNYPQPKTRPQRKAHVFSAQQMQSFEFLKTWIHDLSEGYTEGELKTAFRKAALVLHPDHGGNSTQFMELKEHVEILRELISK